MNIKLRHIALLVTMAVCLTGCDHDATQEGGEDMPVVESGTPIRFAADQMEEQSVTRAGIPLAGPDYGQVSTRAGLSDKGKTMFTVYGFKNMDVDNTTYQTVFNGYTVNWVANSAGTSASNTHGWEYVGQEILGQVEQTVKFWDWSATAYRFFGVTKTYQDLDIKAQGGLYKLTFNVDLTTADGIDEIPYYSHLWYSDGNIEHFPTRQFGRPVTLEFLQPIAKVRFMFVYEDPTENNRTNTPLADISFHPTNGVIKRKGKVKISYPLTGTLDMTETCAFDDDGEPSGISGFTRDYTESDQYWYTVLPIANQGTYTLNVSVDGDPKTTVVPAEFMDWKPGCQYTYIFKVHVDGSVVIDAVQSAFTAWTEEEGEHTVYNW